jgi:hypothetical protein
LTVDQSLALVSVCTRQSLGRLPGYNWLEHFALPPLCRAHFVNPGVAFSLLSFFLAALKKK